MHRLTPVPTIKSTEQTDKCENDKKETEENNEDISRYPARIRSKPKRLGFSDFGTEDNVSYIVDYCYRVADIPTSHDEVLNSNEASKWQKAMKDEIAALNDSDTFDLVQPPEGRQSLGGGGGGGMGLCSKNRTEWRTNP